MVRKKTKVEKSLKAGKLEDQTTPEPKRTLRSKKTTKSEDTWNKKTMTDRKRKNTPYMDKLPSKVIRKSNETKREQATTSQNCNVSRRACRGKVKTVKKTGKKSGLKSVSTRLHLETRKSKSGPKLEPSMGKQKPIRTKRSNRIPSKSTNKMTVNKISSPKRKNIKRPKTVHGPSLTKDITVQQNRELLTTENISSPSWPRKPTFRVISTTKTDLKGLVSTICCVDEHTMWIGRLVFDKLKKVEYQETGRLTIVKQFPHIDFYDFCFDREYNQILYCDRTNKCIMSISSNFEVKEMKCVRPLCPTCITISSDNFIFIGLVHAYAYDCCEPDPRQIIKIDRNGTVHQRINSFQDGSSSFMFTHRCTVNPVNNDLVVVGYITSSKACISNFDADGKIGFSYFGKGPNYSFTPRGLTCSSQGNILVCSENNSDIHILNKHGRCLYLMDMKATGLLETPWSFSWDLSGHLLIGTMTSTTGNILIVEYTEHADDNEYALV